MLYNEEQDSQIGNKMAKKMVGFQYFIFKQTSLNVIGNIIWTSPKDYDNVNLKIQISRHLRLRRQK